MGITASTSKYRVIGNSSDTKSNLKWLATSESKILDFNEESFSSNTAIGKGKFGFVFLSSYIADTQSGKSSSPLHVALKHISKDFILETKSVQRIKQEITLLKTVNNPFIIYYFGGFETTSCICLVTEFAAGGELYNRMKDISKMQEEEAKFYFCELAYVLQYLHNDMNIVYRDLKPENVLLDHHGHIKICDFGFAIQCSHRRTDSRHKLHDACGTANYIAPEVISGQDGTYHNFPVDWWALGCVLFEMICGHPPFGDTATMKKFDVFENVVKKPPSIPSSFSPELRQVLSGLLNKDQHARSDWKGVRGCSWLAGVDWLEIKEQRVRPPWTPKCSIRSPDTRNFLSWPDLAVPANIASKKAQEYCRPIRKTKLLLRGSSQGDADEVSEVDSDDDEEDEADDRSDSDSDDTADAGPKAKAIRQQSSARMLKTSSRLTSKMTSQRGGFTDHGGQDSRPRATSTSTARKRSKEEKPGAVGGTKPPLGRGAAASENHDTGGQSSNTKNSRNWRHIGESEPVPLLADHKTSSRNWRHEEDDDCESEQLPDSVKSAARKWRHEE